MATQQNAPKKELTPEEKAEFLKLQDEEAAKKEALAAIERQQAAAAAGVAHTPAVPPPPPPKKVIGDIPVTVLKTESFVKLGGRSYALKKGAEIMMDPSHAVELSQGKDPWVAPVHVVTSQ